MFLKLITCDHYDFKYNNIEIYSYLINYSANIVAFFIVLVD